MVRDLAARGLKLVTIIDPGVKAEPGYPGFDDAVARRVLCRTGSDDLYTGQVWPGDTAFPDFVTEQARTWWGGLVARHVAPGVAGIWNDMNEPATGVVSPLSMRFGRGAFPTSGSTTSSPC
uniref:Glyco_hydro_31 n=1 Tax=uncultured Intrasporangium sp. TaxID=332040 RepID=A0A060BUG6_9MICO|nr:Glyco_hydro_31 [uncultured Intrasporangium sp.]